MNIGVSCTDCGTVLPSEWAHSEIREKCTNCGSTNITIGARIEEKIPTIHESVKIKSKDERYPKKKNPRQEILTGDEIRKKDGKWMKKDRLIDKENDRYKEIITDPETGEIVHLCNEPLSEHFGHGSARENKTIPMPTDLA